MASRWSYPFLSSLPTSESRMEAEKKNSRYLKGLSKNKKKKK